MSIKVRKGNAIDAVLSGECDVLLHIVNCQGVMGSGIAKEVKERIPSAYNNYKDIVNEGTLGHWSGSDDLKCFNLHAQLTYGRKGKRYLNYKALCESLMDVCDYDFALQDHFEKGELNIAIPYLMGSDRAGGDWDTVCEILEAFLGHHKIIAYKL